MHVGERRGRHAVMGQTEHCLLVGHGRVADVELHEESVELGLRQRVGALVLDRVLGRDDEERLRERVADTVDAHLAFLHRLEQRGLGLRRRAIDLVGQDEVGEDGPGPERELSGA